MAEIHTKKFQICNKRGLHARASAKFVKCVEHFDVEMVVSKDGQKVGGTSIIGLMMLAASKGTFIEVSAIGKESKEALLALETLINNLFDEEE